MNGKPQSKPGADVTGEEEITVTDTLKFASRGGVKLENALDRFHIDLSSADCLDIGAANGGFTDCMLQRGARSVTAVDLHIAFPEMLLKDPRVSVLDNTNVKDLLSVLQPNAFDLISVDLSFISLGALFPLFRSLLSDQGLLICLFKPQYEVGKKELPKSGIVHQEKLIQKAFDRLVDQANASGLKMVGECEIPLLFEHKNKERTVLFRPI